MKWHTSPRGTRRNGSPSTRPPTSRFGRWPGQSPGTQRAALPGLGVQVGVLLPFSRTQETEADLLGLDYIAWAGFDPGAAIELWRNMAAAQRRTPPEFVSMHPGAPTRIRDLQAQMPEAMRTFEAARAAGHDPLCEP